MRVCHLTVTDPFICVKSANSMISSNENEDAAARADDTGEDSVLVLLLQLLVGEVGGNNGGKALVKPCVEEVVKAGYGELTCKLGAQVINDEQVALVIFLALRLVCSAEYNSVEITSLGTSSVISVDDLIAKTLYKFYTKETVSASDSMGYVDGLMDFSTATTGKLPKSISTSLQSIGAAVRVEKTLFGTKWRDYLAYDTSSGKNDAVVVAAEPGTGDKSCVVFEVDLCYTGASSNTLYQLVFAGESNGKFAYMYNLSYANSDNTFTMVDCASTSDNNNRYETKVNFPKKIEKGEWFTLLVEYYTGTKDTVKMKTYINGTLALVSNNYYGHLKDGNDLAFSNKVNYVRFYSFGATEGTLFIDNIRFYGTDDKFSE